MKTDARKRFGWIVLASSAAFLAASLASGAWAQNPPATSGAANSSNAEAAREKAKEKIQSAQETKQAAREEIRDGRDAARDTARDDRRDTRNTRESTGDKVRDARQNAGEKIGEVREDARDTARENRQTTRDTREGARDATRDNREIIRDARRDAFAARREFIVERIRSGDLGLWVRSATNRLMVTDVAGRGAITQTGLKEGDEIVSVNGQAVNSERTFVDLLFAEQANNQPAKVVLNRNGKEQTITINPRPFIAEHLAASDDRLQDFGLILDESDPAHVKIQAVVPRSPAFYAGMRSGDRITAFNGQRIAAVADLVKSISGAIGDRVAVEVNRNNQTRQLDIEVPSDQGGNQTRTALKPTLPNTNTAPPAQPQGNSAQPQGNQRTPPTTQPRLNPPR
jgi:C-terminal processing protease CtpA/Prc